ncbi:MAG: sigma-70 family RNA polymerase sigma factor [Acidobacteriota bacterium]|nr:sigma-70 family RNA polymerase sigma factor [Acidobacteriota bacterium]
METLPNNEVTQLLIDWRKGDQAAFDQLVPLIYQELHKIAGGYLRNERPGHTIQPTALIHEAYLRMVAQQMPEWQNRKHFFGVAAQLMRQILVENARSHSAAKRGAGEQNLPLDEALVYSTERLGDLVALDDALNSLAALDARKSRMVELRFFGGLSLEETAEVMGVSIPTVVREMRLAQAWLHREMVNSSG